MILVVIFISPSRSKRNEMLPAPHVYDEILPMPLFSLFSTYAVNFELIPNGFDI